MQVGDKVRLKVDIFDDGEDHHPTGYIGIAEEIVVIRRIREDGSFSVSQEEILDRSFWVFPSEVKPLTEGASHV